LLERALADGSALQVFRRMVEAQGGDVRVIDDPARLPRAKLTRAVLATKAGYVARIDAQLLGMLAIELGAGRTRAEQAIDHGAGFELEALIGERVARGAPLITIHAANEQLAAKVAARARASFGIESLPPRRRRLVLERLA
jgi:thymidine phosphorylase